MIERVQPRLRRTWVQRGILALNLVLITGALGIALVLNYGYGRAASINRVALGRSLAQVPEDLEPGQRVMNILLVGSDSSANLDDDDPIQIGRRGERFGDVIIIAHVDEGSGEIALLSLPRDLWVNIAGRTRPGRINRAFETGGPATLIETIETEFDIPIHHYVNVDFAGFQGLVGAVGSVDVYFDTPARDWNVNAHPVPRSQTGFVVEEAGCHSLDPETALAYVRSRYYQTQNDDGEWVTDPTSDLGRIRRQQDFLRRTVKQAIKIGARNPFVLRDLIDTGLDNVAIDQRLTPQILVDLGMAYRSFDPDGLQTYSFPATDGRVGQNQVLLPLMDQAEPVLALFRGADFDDPSTVALQVEFGPELAGSELVEQLRPLRRAGFDYRTVERTEMAPGLVLRHGPDGRHAAELVAAELGESVHLEQVAWLAGRSLTLLLGGEPLELEPPDSVPGDQAQGDVALHPNETEAPGGPEVAIDGGEEPSVTSIDPMEPDSAASELESTGASCG